MDEFGLVYDCNQHQHQHHQVGKTEGTLKILARLKDQAEERDRVPLGAQSSSKF